MISLTERIAALIARDGAIGIDRFWNLALFDPSQGYYTTRMPFGRTGDFTTAPEISQMFGELLAAWLVAAWHELGRPQPFLLCEIGPGRGTLMADLLRTVRKLDQDFLRAAQICLVETSDRLAAVQHETLAVFDLPIRRVRRLDALPRRPILIVANELFDAVAIRQFVYRAGRWHERLVGSAGETFTFVEGPPANPQPRNLPGPAPSEGTILELSPDRSALAADIAARLLADGGAALLVDYGHAHRGYGDTLQAIAAHRFADPLAAPGERDITSHVDFEALAAVFSHAGAHVAPIAEQGAFLASLGLRERAFALAERETAETAGTALAAARRLAGDGPGEMGRLFKVLAAASRPLSLPPFPPSVGTVTVD